MDGVRLRRCTLFGLVPAAKTPALDAPATQTEGVLADLTPPADAEGAHDGPAAAGALPRRDLGRLLFLLLEEGVQVGQADAPDASDFGRRQFPIVYQSPDGLVFYIQPLGGFFDAQILFHHIHLFFWPNSPG